MGRCLWLCSLAQVGAALQLGIGGGSEGISGFAQAQLGGFSRLVLPSFSVGMAELLKVGARGLNSAITYQPCDLGQPLTLSFSKASFHNQNKGHGW